jgi:site-specific DNA recombinase
MTPSEAVKGAKRYRYYISQGILQGRKHDAGSVARVSAPQIEAKVLEAVRDAVGDSNYTADSLRNCLDKITIGHGGLQIRWNDTRSPDAPPRTISVAWTPSPTQRRREIIQGDGVSRTDLRPMKIETRRAFMAAYSKARFWLDRLVVDPGASTATLANAEGRTERSIRQTLSLAMLDPHLVEAAIERRLPRGIGLTRLMDLPPLWSEQWTVIGLEPPVRT